MDLVSVIVPVYNVENYLEKCIYSILKQSYSSIEVIIIDDGSSDKSGQICDEIEKKDNRVSVYHLKNKGVASARNTGIKYARGKYLAFVDSDDILESKFIEKAVIKMARTQYVSSAFNTINDNGEEKLIDYMSQFGDIVNIHDYLDVMLNYQAGAYWGANWGKLYLTEIIKANDILFEFNIDFAEDFRFNLKYLMYIDSIALIHEPSYFYRIDTVNSLSKKARDPEKYWREYLELYYRYKALCNAHEIFDENQERVCGFLIGAYISVLQECAYIGHMCLRDLIIVSENMEGSRELQSAARCSMTINGRKGHYAKLLSKHQGKRIALEIKVRSLIRR